MPQNQTNIEQVKGVLKVMFLLLLIILALVFFRKPIGRYFSVNDIDNLPNTGDETDEWLSVEGGKLQGDLVVEEGDVTVTNNIILGENSSIITQQGEISSSELGILMDGISYDEIMGDIPGSFSGVWTSLIESGYVNSDNTLSNDYFNAYEDLLASGVLNNDAATDLLTREQLDNRFINEGQVDSIITEMILNGSITSDDIGDGIVTAIKLADGSVTTAKIIDGAITSGKIEDGTIVSIDIADGSVITAKIADGSVTDVKLADGSIGLSKLSTAMCATNEILKKTGPTTWGCASDNIGAGGGINSITYGNGTSNSGSTTDPVLDVNVDGSTLTIVTDTLQVADNGITAVKLANNAVTTAKILDGNVTSAKIADGTIAAVDIASDAVVTAKIQNGAVTDVKIADGSISLAKLSNAMCSDGQILKKTSGAWACATDAGAGVNSVSAGSGLGNTGTSSDPILDVNVDGTTIQIVTDQLRVGDGSLTNAKLNTSTQFLDVRNSSNSSQFTITNSTRAIQFASSGSLTVAFDNVNRRITYGLASGSGSGLDADTLDGINSTGFLQTSGGTMTGNLVFSGSSLNLGGNTFLTGNTTLSATELDILDGGINFTELTGQLGDSQISAGAVDLDSSEISGILPLANGGTGVGSFISGSVVFAGASSLSQDNTNFFWNDSTNRLGLGTNNPGQTLSVAGTLGIIETGTSPQYYTIFQGGDQSGNITYTLPAASSNGFLRNTSGTLSWDTSLGTGTVTQIDTGNGLTGGPITTTGTIALGALTANWNQTGAFDIVLNNASSELVIRDSDNTNNATIDVGNLASDALYSFSGASGTVLTTGNYTGSLDSIYLNANGDTVTGNLIFSSADLNIGANNIVTGATTISSTELDILDGGVNFSELTGTLGDAQISAGAVDLDSNEIAGILPIANGGTGAGSFTSGSVIFAGSSTLLENNINFFWDNTDNRLGLGTNTPGQTLSVAGTLGIVETGTSPQYYTILQSGDQNGDITYTLPSSSVNGFLRNNAGTLTWDSSLGTGTVTQIDTGNGLTGGPITTTGTIALGALTANWNQTGAFDIVLNNASSELVIRDSDNTNNATIDVGDLASDATYSFAGASGTVLTTGNYTGSLDSIYLNANGDTVIGNLIFSSADLNIGTNNIVTGATTISSTELDILDSGINFSELTGTLGDAQISAGAVDLDSNEIAGILPIANGGTGAGSFTSGSVIFAGSSTLLENNINFFWDNTDNRLGLGTNTPGQTLSVAGTLGIVETGTSPQYYTIFQGGDQNGDIIYTLPSSSANGFLRNNAGTLTWDNAVGTGTVTQIDTGNGLTGGPITTTGTIALGALTANWNQTGAFDIVLNNASSELVIRDSDNTNNATIDVGDLASDATYSFAGASGTVLTTGNYTGSLDSIYLNANGDTVTGNLIFSSADLNIGTNNIVTGATTISSTELDILDGGVNFSELTGTLGDTQISAGAVDLDSNEIAGILPIANGGTNNNTFTDNQFVYFDGSGIVSSGFVLGDFLRSNASDTYESGNTLTFAGTTDFNGDMTLSDQNIVFDAASFTSFDLTGDMRFLTTNDDNDFIYMNTSSDAAALYWEGYSATNDPGIRVNPVTNEIEYRDEDAGTWTTFDSLVSGISGSGSASRITYWDSSSNITYADNLFWDSGNSYLGIGTTAPDRPLDVLNATVPQLRLTHTDGSVYGDFQINSSGNLVIDTTGNNITLTGEAVSAASFSGGGSGLTGILEANITDGTLLARVASTETISGAWTFTAEPLLSGAGRHSKTVTLNSEYPGAVLTTFYGAGTDTATSGTMIADTEGTSDNLMNYYEWNTSNVVQQYYTVAVRVTLPQDFDAWQSSNAIQIYYRTETSVAPDSLVDVYIRNANESPSSNVTSNTNYVTNSGWNIISIDDSVIDDGSSPEWDSAGETAVIYLRLGSRSDNYSRVGDIKLNYLSRF